MPIRATLQFLFKAIIVGVAAFFIVLLLRPSNLPLPSTQQPPPSSTSRQSPSRPLQVVSYADAVERAAPAVVNIYTAKIIRQQPSPLLNDPLFRFFFGEQKTLTPQRRQNSLGSGVIISESGYLLTNNHVIQGADEIEILLWDGRALQAELVGADPESDLAVLKVNANHLPTVQISDSDQLRVGDVVLAIGNPFGVGQTVTQGIVSATGRNRLGINTFENFIQTDAAINPGNSGGALINAYGELIGINTAIFSKSGGSQGIGFAIPVNLAKRVQDQIITHGRPMRGWFGIETQNLTPELAASFRLGNTHGVLISGIQTQGPADQAGLKPGDIIIELADQPISSSRDILKVISNTLPGTKLAAEIIRNGSTKRLSVTVGERPVSR